MASEVSPREVSVHVVASMRELIRKSRVHLIGGTSHAGKSTLAQALASRLGWQYMSTDKLARHPGRPWAEAPNLVPDHVAEHYLSLPVDELITDVMDHYRDNVWPIARPIITEHATNLSVDCLVMEGSALLPELVAAIHLENVSCVWLTADPKLIEKRIYAGSGYAEKESRERKMIDRFLERSVVYNAQMREAVKDLDLRLVEVRATSSVEALVDECLKALS